MYFFIYYYYDYILFYFALTNAGLNTFLFYYKLF